MSIKKRQKADHRADTRGKPWAGIPHVVLDSLAFLHCDLWERAILLEIVRAMNGYNNGAIALSQREMAARLKTSNFRRIGRSIAGLMGKGLLDSQVEGQWKERMARQYRLTFVNTGSNGRFRPATNDYRDWQPHMKTGVEPVSAGMANSAEPVSAEGVCPAAPASADFSKKSPKASSSAAEPASSLISSHTFLQASSEARNASIDGQAAQPATNTNDFGSGHVHAGGWGCPMPSFTMQFGRSSS